MADAKRVLSYGVNDDISVTVAEDRMLMHDFHATDLLLLSLEHTKLTYRHSGRDYHLTDEQGNVVKKILV